MLLPSFTWGETSEQTFAGLPPLHPSTPTMVRLALLTFFTDVWSSVYHFAHVLFTVLYNNLLSSSYKFCSISFFKNCKIKRKRNNENKWWLVSLNPLPVHSACPGLPSIMGTSSNHFGLKDKCSRKWCTIMWCYSPLDSGLAHYWKKKRNIRLFFKANLLI